MFEVYHMLHSLHDVICINVISIKHCTLQDLSNIHFQLHVNVAELNCASFLTFTLYIFISTQS